jgi:hypothetical protein
VNAPPFVIAKRAFSFTVTALDQFGNTASSYFGTVGFNTSDVAPGAAVPGHSALTAGVGVFSATLVSPGIQFLSAADVNVPGINGSAVITVPATLYIPNLSVVRGGSVVVPINVTSLTDPAGALQQIGVSSWTFVLFYDPNIFTVSASDLSLGTISNPTASDPSGTGPGDGYSPSHPNGWKVREGTLPGTGPGALSVTLLDPQFAIPVTGTAGGTLATVNFHVSGNAPLGPSMIDLAADVAGPNTQPNTFVSDASDAVGGNQPYNILPVPEDNTVLSPSYAYSGSDAVDGVITITGTNLPPVVTNDSYGVTERSFASDPALTVAAPGLLTNDSDPQGLPLTTSLLSSTAHGSVSLNSDGSFSYMPTAGYIGSDSFQFQVSNETGSVTATVSLSVTARLSIPTNLIGAQGGVVTVPVNIDNPNPTGSGGITGLELAINYDPKVFTFAGVQSGPDYPVGPGNWDLESVVNQASGLLGISMTNTGGNPNAGTVGDTLVLITCNVNSTAPIGSSPINLVPANTPINSTVVTGLTAQNPSYAMPPRPLPTFASNDPGVDGLVAITDSSSATHFAVTASPATFPGVQSGPSSFAVTGLPLVFSVTALDLFNNVAPNYAGTVHFTSSDTTAGVVLPSDSVLASGVGIFSATLQSPGNQFLTASDVVSPTLAGTSSAIVTRGLVVTSFSPTPSGFVVTFDKAFDSSSVAMYTPGTTPDDIILATFGSQVSVRGSVVYNSAASPTSLTFIKTDVASAVGTFNPSVGMLAPGSYTVTLRSQINGNGFADSLGVPLDGDNSGTPGDNFKVTFSVSPPPVAVGIPDFARGPSNTDALFLPSSIGNGGTFELSYTNPNTLATATATVTFSTTSAILRANLQSALNNLSSISTTAGVPNAVVVVIRDVSSGANVQITFQNSLATATGQLLMSETPGVSPSLATIDVPNNIPGNGIPVALSSGLGVTSGSFTLQYNPALLDITGAVSKIPGVSFTVNTTINSATSATALLSLSSPTAISATAKSITIGSLLATVPFSATASYGAKALLHFTGEQLNGTGGPISVTGRDGVQVAAYFGDVVGAGGPLNLNDVIAISTLPPLIPSTKAQTLPGFAAFGTLDPVVIGDVALQNLGFVNSTDTGAINQELISPKASIPYVPIGLSVTPPGPITTPAVSSFAVADPQVAGTSGTGAIPLVHTSAAAPLTRTEATGAHQRLAYVGSNNDQLPAVVRDLALLQVLANAFPLGSQPDHQRGPTGQATWGSSMSAADELFQASFLGNEKADSTGLESLLGETVKDQGTLPLLFLRCLHDVSIVVTAQNCDTPKDAGPLALGPNKTLRRTPIW